MSFHDETEVTARRESLARCREFVDQACARAGAAEEERYVLKLAVDEACSNIIEHAYGPDREGSIGLAVDGDGTEVRITIVDAGPPFHPDQAPRPDLDADWRTRTVGGLGWHIVRQVVDEMQYVTEGSRNRLVLVKRLRGR